MISFIIPTKNEEAVLEKILQCLLEYKGEKEIIISDGQSTDSTLLIAKKYTNKIVEHKGSTRQTIAQGRNAGARIATGNYFVFLDADVYIPNINSFMKKVEDLFGSDKNLAGLTVPCNVFKEQETFADKIIFSILHQYILILNNYFKIGAAAGEFQMVRKDIFQKTNGYREDLIASEDFEFFKRISKIGKTYFEKNLTIYHTGRRAHKIGWPRLLTEWMLNNLSVIFRKKAHSKEWKVIR
ncbi:MAG: Glycosyl transferase family 2 [Candidatus Nomurabacteria bacterium GW2011_GWE1_32_28]|uniref:Glycosyl transferase family 2 n=1 Tax=Candidatus Nomurabacteria bacterium GW2011_GWF1_31_48 TaxID=1618767 RepID=A0A0F9YFZ2_9BACT|nr:MAG: Glycosyl transferase family 2 [Candidatus Nomurabacteria bacterium GW2011_GWF2_30_133]KKP28761.1 MAG: Glycosyl transferase family 2 [Candidatus Nomurabacteria bacterium GW2011_GWE2_31_40]KKP30338.1 MAG: Glycosyl transferase family 2 [Candidatus Nomurabacteria bacterium GW2011_GWF1_31_48]KKP34865.1 MAG: Glycosyl transferase family 2 [Candidatus Nomurabacteria bacterium GW2011_GWE1_32_28]HAS80958.1 hypothetical protein [Candidatus Nomurabacteria bacterium]